VTSPTGELFDLRWTTFDRKMQQIEAAGSVCNAQLAHFFQKLAYR
jgi:hypothetical protein